jgi:very-short-patch-repair endonuclease
MSRSAQSTLTRQQLVNGIAAPQEGVVTRKQLLQVGLSRESIARRTRNGMLIRIHAGVYRIGPLAGRFAAERAALLACNGGVLSHLTAANLLGILTSAPIPQVVDVTLSPLSHPRRREGIRSHRRNLEIDEVTHSEGLPVTTLARTLLDLAAMPNAALDSALARAEHRDPLVRDRVLALLGRYPSCRGARGLRVLISDAAASSFTRSQAEETFMMLIRSSGLPRPETNVRVAGYEVDFYWRVAGVVVEVDGYEFHRSRRAFLRDRQRDSALAAAGIMVIRLSWQQLTTARDRTLVELALALGRTAS